MAPTGGQMKNNKFAAKVGNLKKSKNGAQGVNKKRKWISEHKMFEGSVKEGQGFAFKRKEKVKHEYNKLLRKENKRKTPGSKAPYEEEKYPEHLRHLYAAEAERLRSEAWANRVNRSKLRMKGRAGDAAEDDAAEKQSEAADEDVTGGAEGTDSVSERPEAAAAASEKESLPISNRMRKKIQKKTSYQKTKEEFEKTRETRKKKKEDFLKDKQQREEAIQKYKQKKMETFQMLSKKTKKGQPNLNLQMDYLLQKIQGTEK
ncbi:thyroid transcription factor 1-associated protein 26 homolog [Embiotoca jacksoni]|uniref:thyroid transcription factor 1-associated protein 26 homolog n=1 Tax=Embiotoca jacksoni TaxID=100190 RepID=UPI003704658A